MTFMIIFAVKKSIALKRKLNTRLKSLWYLPYVCNLQYLLFIFSSLRSKIPSEIIFPSTWQTFISYLNIQVWLATRSLSFCLSEYVFSMPSCLKMLVQFSECQFDRFFHHSEGRFSFCFGLSHFFRDVCSNSFLHSSIGIMSFFPLADLKCPYHGFREFIYDIVWSHFMGHVCVWVCVCVHAGIYITAYVVSSCWVPLNTFGL